MLTHYPAATRGLTKLGWLTSYHCFSFNTFHDPARMHFGPLRVLNDDRVEPGGGFGAHPHDNMEIVSYVMQGALEHRDSTGTHGVIRAGDVQRMRAGTGIVHSEYNNSTTDPVHFLQIWFFPDTDDLTPGYEEKSFVRDDRLNTLLPVASPRMDLGGVHIQQDATMFISALDAGRDVALPIAKGRGAYVYLISGAATVNGTAIAAGDAATVIDEPRMTIAATAASEIVAFDVEL